MSGHNANIANHPHQLSLRMSASADTAEASVDGSYSAIGFVGGWGSSMYQYAYNDPVAASGSVFRDSLAGEGKTVKIDFVKSDTGAADASSGVAASKELYIISGSYGTGGQGAAGSSHPGGMQVALGDGSVRTGPPEAGEWPWQISTHRQGASGDVDGDGVDDLIVGAGGGGPHVKAFDGSSAGGGAQVRAFDGAAGGGTSDDVIVDVGIVTGENPAAAIDHGVTVLAWARVDGVSPAAGGLNDYALITDFNTTDAAIGGTQVLMGDGSVRFIRESIDLPGGYGDDLLIGGQTSHDGGATAEATNNLHQLGLAVHSYDSGVF